MMPYTSPYLDASGMHIPTYEERMESLLAGYKQIFGTDVYLEADSKDYQLLSLFARAVDDLTAAVTDVYNARDPNYASGNALDLLLSLNGIRRRSATYGTVTLTLTGAPGAVLPAGMQARDDQGFLWRIPTAVTLGEDGKAEASAACLTAGAILAPAGTITTIHTPTSTWNSVTNAEPSTPGRDVETDAAVRERRSLSVSLPSRGILDGLRSALADLDGVQYVSVLENAEGEEDANGLPAHSVCAVVDGGSDADIAKTLYLKKSPGVKTYGSSSAVYTDEWGNKNTMGFTRPTAVPVTIHVTLKQLDGWDSDTMQAAIKAAVTASVTSLGIGKPLIVSTLYGVIFTACGTSTPAFAVTSLTAQTASQSATGDAITAAYNEQLSTDAAHILLKVVE